MTRMEIRTYYRKCAGLFSLLSAWLAIVASGLSIYISEFEELDPEVVKDAGELVINGLYVVFSMGAVWAVFALLTGIFGIAGKSEGVFSFLRFQSALMMVLMLFSAFLSIQVFRNPEMEWTTERRVMTLLYLVISVMAAVAAAAVLLCSVKGMRYYDRGKKLAKDVPDMPEGRMDSVIPACRLVCGMVFTLSACGMEFYFHRIIQYFDEEFVQEHHLFSSLCFVLFVIGVILVILGIAAAGSAILKNKGEKQIRLLAELHSGYLLVVILVSIFMFGQKFVKSQYPSADYVIFTILLGVLGLAFLVFATGMFRKKR